MKERTRVLIGAIMLVVLVAFTFVINYLLTRKDESNLIVNLDPELQRAMTYEQFEDGDEDIEGTDNVKFSAFFLRDLDGDGYAEKIKGTCKEIGKEDTLYMEIIVQTEGYLKDGKIQIDGKNFYLQTTLPKDTELKDNYISPNTKSILLEDLNNGIQKLLTAKVRAGDYAENKDKTAGIGHYNTDNYSRNDNVISLTGTYVTSEGEEIEITKEINLSVDWYGTTYARIYGYNEPVYDIEQRINDENGTITLAFNFSTEEINKQLNMYSYHYEGVIPELNGYKPISVKPSSDSGKFTYDEETGYFSIVKQAETDGNGKITKSIWRTSTDIITIVYPLEAYSGREKKEGIKLTIPVSAYYEGFNNPNEEFENPKKSNVIRKTIEQYFGYELNKNPEVQVTVGDRVYTPIYHYFVSKRKPLSIYNGISEEEEADRYKVTWKVQSGTSDLEENLIIREERYDEEQKCDYFKKSDSSVESMEDIVTNVGIYFESALSYLDNCGDIKVYDDETGILVHTFTHNELRKYTANNPFIYDASIKHIKVVIESMKAKKYIDIINIKELDDDYIVEHYTRENFDELKYIYSNVAIYRGSVFLESNIGSANYENPFSTAKISLGKDAISTQTTEQGNDIIIKTQAKIEKNQVKWKDGIFLIKLPNKIIDVKVNNVNSNKNSVKIDSYEVIKNSNGKFIKVITSNSTPQEYEITINVDITADPRMATQTDNLILYAINEECENYENDGEDIYDIDGDGNAVELINKEETPLNMVSPNSLITNQTISDFNDEGTIVIGPEVAELKPIYTEEDIEKQTAKIGAQFRNNYSGTISEVKMLGKIPFEGNTYVLRGGDLESQFTANMTSDGIVIPSNIQEYVKIYYSENENPNIDIDDESNQWKLKEEVEDWTKIKTWLIDMGDIVIHPGDEYTFFYNIEIPFSANYNEIAYSHHGIYFCLETSEGKYKSQTEPSKTGVMLADNYNLMVTKFQKHRGVNVKGAIYRVSKLDDEGNIEESQTAITDENGVIEMANLYAEKVYEIVEIKSPKEYELNEDVIKIIGHVNRTNGMLSAELLDGTIMNNISITKNENENYKVSFEVEDEVRPDLLIKKVSAVGTDVKFLKRAKYKITGGDLPAAGRILTTNANGEAVLKSLKVGATYYLQEIKAPDGYYLNDKVIEFKIEYKVMGYNGGYFIVMGGEEHPEVLNTDSTEDNIPVCSIEINDEEIPKYDLEISKIKNKTVIDGETNPGEIEYIQGAKFRLYKDHKIIGTYTSDENGKITIENLNAYEEEKGIDQTYILKEIYAPEGYTAVKDIVFSVTDDGGVLSYEEVVEKGEEEKTCIIEGNKVKLTVKDNPIFKLVKKDGETNELLSNVKFSIYNTDNGKTPARNSKGEIIGIKETINGKEYYVVKTDSNGEISIDLPEGAYVAVEVEADEKYDIKKEYYFGIGRNSEISTLDSITEWLVSYGEGHNEKIWCGKELSDGSYLMGGSKSVTEGENTRIKGFLIRYGSDGEKLWEVTIGTEVRDIKETSDGSILIGGTTNYYPVGRFSRYGYGTLVAKVSINGEIQWESSSDSVLNHDTYPETDGYINGVEELSDGSYIAAGYFNGPSLNVDGMTAQNVVYYGYSDDYYRKQYLFIKYNSDGEIQELIAEGGEYNESINKIKVTDDDGFIVIGTFSNSTKIGEDVYSANGGDDSIIIKYNNELEVQWVKTFGNSRYDYIKGIGVDNDGNYIISGYFYDTIEIESYEFTSKGLGDTYVIKYDRDGNLLNAFTIGEIGLDAINNISICEEGGYVLTGYFSGYMLEVGKHRLISSDSVKNGVLIKYNDNDEVETAFNIDNEYESELVYGICDSDGKYVLFGSYNDKLTIHDSTITNDGGIGCFIAKIKDVEEKTKLEVTKVNTFGGTGSDVANFIDDYEDGGYVVGGTYSDTISIGNNEYTSAGNKDVYITKYNSAGQEEWTTTFGGSGEDQINKIYATSDGGVIVYGFYHGLVTQIGDYTFRSNNIGNTLIIKYNADGEIEWANGLGGVGNKDESHIIELNSGDYIICSSFVNSININGVYYTSRGESDELVLTIDPHGNILKVFQCGGTSYDYMNGCLATSDGGYIVAFRFCYNFSMNGRTYTSHNLNQSYNDLILAKFSQDSTVEWTKQMGGELGDFVYVLEEDNPGEIECVFVLVSDNSEIEGENESYDAGTYCMKLDLDGNIHTIKKIDIQRSKMLKVSDGYIVFTSNNFYKYDENFERIYLKKTEPLILYDAIEKNGMYYLVGYTYGNDKEIDGHTINSNGGSDAVILNISEGKGIADTQELIVENVRKEFKVTTDIEEIDGVKGGTISGYNQSPYEKIKYGDSSIKQIKMIPNENYEIIDITVNGKKYSFEADADGSYTMPLFENVKEDKNIVVKFAAKDNKITINKIDSVTGDPLDGAMFRIDQIEEREEPVGVIGELTGNGEAYYTVNLEEEITGVLGELTSKGSYYFVEQDGKYYPTNSMTWQVANVEGATTGVQSSSADSYIPIDLTGLSGHYKVVVNAECSTQSNNDIGFVRLTDSTTTWSYNASNQRKIYLYFIRSRC